MGEMTGSLADFLPSNLLEQARKDFEPCARYYSPMDCIVYLEEDCAYRADRVDKFLTILWHPDRGKAIGVKLKGFRFIFERLKVILGANGADSSQDRFAPLVQALEVAVTAGMGSGMLAEAERQRLSEGYAKARELVRSVKFDVCELREAA